MKKIVQIEYLDILKSNYEDFVESVLEKCFKEENLLNTKLYVSITLTNSENIKKINKKFRNIDKETDVLSFPFFEKEELINNNFNEYEDILGDIVISVGQVETQAKEFGHSFQREFAYMIVHGFYHIMGYDHINENDKINMREKEENILSQLNLKREI